jgi:hypothetical protein
MIVGSYGPISQRGYHPVPTPIVHASIVPISCISAFVWFTGATESVGANNLNKTIAVAILANDVTDSVSPPRWTT